MAIIGILEGLIVAVGGAFYLKNYSVSTMFGGPDFRSFVTDNSCSEDYIIYLMGLTISKVDTFLLYVLINGSLHIVAGLAMIIIGFFYYNDKCV